MQRKEVGRIVIFIRFDEQFGEKLAEVLLGHGVTPKRAQNGERSQKHLSPILMVDSLGVKRLKRRGERYRVKSFFLHFSKPFSILSGRKLQRGGVPFTISVSSLLSIINLVKGLKSGERCRNELKQKSTVTAGLYCSNK